MALVEALEQAWAAADREPEAWAAWQREGLAPKENR